MSDIVDIPGTVVGKSRWWATYDLATEVTSRRFFHMFLVDWALLLQRQSPFDQGLVDFNDTLNDVFDKAGQSMRVAAFIMKDSLLFDVHPIGYTSSLLTHRSKSSSHYIQRQFCLGVFSQT